MIKIPTTAALVIFLTLAVSGCAIFGAEGPPPPCTRVSVLPDAQSLTKFKEGQGRDIIDILFEARITNISGECEYDIDDDIGEGTLATEIGVSIELIRGAANRDRQANLEYFVVVTDASKNILNKKVFPVAMEFPGNLTRLVYSDNDPPLTLDFPLKRGMNGNDFEVFIGLQLSREELEYNRRKRKMINQ